MPAGWRGRGQFVASSAASVGRLSILAGRTGTRSHIGRPQTRWEAGISLARSFLEGRHVSLDGGK